MRFQNASRVLLFTLAAALLPGAAAAAISDACSMLTVDQVSSAMGAKVGDPQKISATTCQWVVSGTMNRVTLMANTAKAFDFWKTPMSASVQSTPVSGIGDDAYFLQMTKQTALAVKKGDTYFKLQVYSNGSDDQKKDAEKKLGSAVASQL